VRTRLASTTQHRKRCSSAHLGVTLFALWEQPQADGRQTDVHRTLIRRHLTYDDGLISIVEPLCTYARTDKSVIFTMARTLLSLKEETTRRDLPGPTEPIDQQLTILADVTKQSDLLGVDKYGLLRLMDS